MTEQTQDRTPSELELALWDAYSRFKNGGDAAAVCAYLAGIYKGKDDGAASLFAHIACLGK